MRYYGIFDDLEYFRQTDIYAGFYRCLRSAPGYIPKVRKAIACSAHCERNQCTVIASRLDQQYGRANCPVQSRSSNLRAASSDEAGF